MSENSDIDGWLSIDEYDGLGIFVCGSIVVDGIGRKDFQGIVSLDKFISRSPNDLSKEQAGYYAEKLSGLVDNLLEVANEED